MEPQLINKCLQDAQKQSKQGVVVVTNSKTSWTPSKDIFFKNNFQIIDSTPYDFELLAYKFDGAVQDPYFPTDWDSRVKKFDKLTILRSFQCPYVEIATENREFDETVPDSLWNLFRDF